ncbi:hypothetical protein GCM10027422_16020 [Hymenobacter arcticus]
MPLPLAFFLSLVLCVANVLRNHVAAPDNILPTPILFIAITGLLNWRQPRVVASAASTALLIYLHDAGLRFYGGGAHDLEGDGVLTALLFMGSCYQPTHCCYACWDGPPTPPAGVTGCWQRWCRPW